MSDKDKLMHEWVEEYAFQVPYNGTNEFYNKERLEHGKAGFLAGYEARDEEVNRLKTDLELLRMSHAPIKTFDLSGF